MITDTFGRLSFYSAMLPYFNEIQNYLENTDIRSLEEGRYEISGDNVFILIQKYMTKSGSEKKWESHRKYIDIQIVLGGEEYMGYCPAGFLEESEMYNSGKDVVFYGNSQNSFCSILTKPENFCIFFPYEVHKPCCHISQPCEIRKAVIKVRQG